VPIGSSTQLRPEQHDALLVHAVPALPHAGVVDWQIDFVPVGSVTQLSPEQHGVFGSHTAPAELHVGVVV
jgi:hypothetical protein